MKFIHKVIIVILLLILVYSLLLNNKDVEDFNVESKLGSVAGFYSQLFFLLNHYLYCKKNQQNFKINSENWGYKYKNGWEDYFEPIELNYNNEEYIQKSHGDILSEYELSEYKTAIDEVYIYNKDTFNEIQNVKNKLKLLPYEYDSIYIRRGDKLVDEANIILEEDYLNLLLSLNPQCKTIFVQTDDYNCVINLQNIINNNQYQITIETLCDKNNNGHFQNNLYIERANKNNVIKGNEEYLNSIKENSKKPFEEKTENEKKEHTLELITGIDIIRYSNICVTDYQSNVGRFMKLSHHKPENVFDVISKSNELDYNKKICPVYSF